MIYVVGSGFSGLTTAYALLKKNIKCSVISPSENKERDLIPIIKYLLKLNMKMEVMLKYQ